MAKWYKVKATIAGDTFLWRGVIKALPGESRFVRSTKSWEIECATPDKNIIDKLLDKLESFKRVGLTVTVEREDGMEVNTENGEKDEKG